MCRCCWTAAAVAAAEFSPVLNPAAVAALLEEGDAAHARCKKLLPPSWAAALTAGREMSSPTRPVIERHAQRSPDAWQMAIVLEAAAQYRRQDERLRGKVEEGLPSCDGCGVHALQLKWCACRLKRYCSRECQKRDFPAHKAECKKARGVA